MKDIRFNKFKDSAIGNFLIEMKEFVKEYNLGIIEMALTQKGHQSWFRRRVMELGEKGYFDISVKNNKTFFKLTTKGCNLAELLKFSVGKLKWDKRWRVLIFDIPEKQRYKRDALRKKLLELNFKQLQESVWITPYPLPEIFSDFLAELRVRPYLFSLTVERINREKELKSFFKL